MIKVTEMTRVTGITEINTMTTGMTRDVYG